MNNKYKFLPGQFLIALNIFVLFLLIFSTHVVIPFWLQPIGRMHPAIIHFPIVLLILSVVFEFLGDRNKESTQANLIKYSQTILFAGAFLSGITVVMGLFLSKENTYEGDTLFWHKWTGSAIFFISSILFALKSNIQFKRPISLVSNTVLIICIISTGHYGGVLSHGENFILQPILSNIKKPVVPIEKAVVFDDLVRPILEQKCMSCHNLQKQKGELSFADTLSILKGGKSGKVFIAGNPALSLLLERIHLPVDDEKHMPPSNKLQLTAEEIMILGLWIKDQASFTKKVIDLPSDDSLRMMANANLSQKDMQEETFNFSAADEKTISRLNSNYCSIEHISKVSPALDVRIYNKETYNVKQLQDLSDIKKQIISLSLSKLPVTDEDLKTIVMFENLQKLDLNFTNVTTSGLAILSGLSNLQTISLTGTKIQFQGLKDIIRGLKKAQKITLWNTLLTSQEIEQLKHDFKQINFIGGFSIDPNEQLKLNPPQVKNASMVFNTSMSVDLYHPINGTEIRYTTDGTDPDSISSPVFNHKTIITKNTTIKAKAFKKGWYSSDVVPFSFYKNTFIPDSVTILSLLNGVHQAEGAQTFFNTKLGTIGANNPAWANFWAGTRKDDLEVEFLFEKPISLSSFGFHYMIEEATGIFPPASVEVWGGENAEKLKLITKISPAMPKPGDTPSLRLAEASFKARTFSYLKIIAKPFKRIKPITKKNQKPAPKKDKKPVNPKDKRPDAKKDKYQTLLLLIDEMFLN